MKKYISEIGLVSLFAAVVIMIGCNVTIPSWIPVPNPDTNTTVIVTNTLPNPLDLGAWGGHPDITVDTKGGIHIIVDGGSPVLFGADIVNSQLTTYTLNANDCNPNTKQLFNPSTIVLDDGTQLVTAWFFAFDDITGCNPPYVWYRQTGQAWKKLAVPLFTFDWNNSKLCKVSPTRVRIFGLQNVWADLEMNNGILAVVAGGSYQSGSRGGGEKEARTMINGKMVVANSGCRMNGGSYFRSEISCPNAVMWATYSNYPSMGSDDTGHASVCVDGTNSSIIYIEANYGGIVYSIWDGHRLICDPKGLPILDRNGWSGAYKYPLSVTSCPTGGCYVAYTAGGSCVVQHINFNNTPTTVSTWNGTTPAITVSSNGTIHAVYGQGGRMWYRRINN